jgi:uncharacterized protein (DUF1697 family)
MYGVPVMATLTIIGGSTTIIESGNTVLEAVRQNLEATLNASTSVAFANDNVVKSDYIIKAGDQITLNPKIANA